MRSIRGVLTDLRPSPSYNGGGLKKAESVMSFHVDLGPSMLGDILGVMEKEDDDQGFEEGKSSEGRASPLHCNLGGVEMDEEMREVVVKEEEPEELVAHSEDPMRAPSSVDLEIQSEGTSTPEPHHKHPHHLDSCSVSSSGSAALEEKPTNEPYEEDIGVTDNTCIPDNDQPSPPSWKMRMMRSEYETLQSVNLFGDGEINISDQNLTLCKEEKCGV